MILWDFASVNRLTRSGAFTEIDLYLAGLLCRVTGRDDPDLSLAAALAGKSMLGGHVCVDLGRLDPETLAALDQADIKAPGTQAWLDALAASKAVGQPGDFKPLILDGSRLYLERLHRAESALAQDLKARADQDMAMPDPDLTRQALARLFPDPSPGSSTGGGPDRQKLAAFAALRKGLCVVTGGPGTGKTHAVARMLALLAALLGPDLRVGLAAPTGKAAARLTQSLARALGPALATVLDHGVPDHLAAPKAVTIHRLLGARADGGGFNRHASNPLALDLLVVDEASMVDLRLMAALVEALPKNARLVLLGDKDQLASVAPGAVMGDICGARDLARFSAAFAADCAKVGMNADIDVAAEEEPPLLDCIVELTHSFRFHADQAIGAVSRAVRAGKGGEALELLKAGQGGVSWLDLPPGRPAHALLEPLLAEGYAPLCRATSVQEALGLAEGFRVLTPLRKGLRGVEGLNLLARQALERKGLVTGYGRWYERQPLLVLRNDRNLGLANGDTGVVFQALDGNGSLRAWFPAGDGEARDLALARLPEHEPVYAMTVHKSQGSEFTHLVLVLPEAADQVLGRELLYTALTRAREQVLVAGSPDVLLRAAGARAERRTGLGLMLWDGGAGE